jgi:hypothetical protein
MHHPQSPDHLPWTFWALFLALCALLLLAGAVVRDLVALLLAP